MVATLKQDSLGFRRDPPGDSVWLETDARKGVDPVTESISVPGRCPSRLLVSLPAENGRISWTLIPGNQGRFEVTFGSSSCFLSGMKSARAGMRRFGGGAMIWGIGLGAPARAQDSTFAELFDQEYVPVAEELLRRGEYAAVLREALRAAERSGKPAVWRGFYLEGAEALGREREAKPLVDGWLEEHGDDLPFLVQSWHFYRRIGEEASAEAVLATFNEAAQSQPLRDRDARELVAMGRMALELGASPKRVLQQFFEPAIEKAPGLVDAYLATGELALAKDDFALAAERFREGLKQAPGEPELRLGLARAFWPSDREEGMRQLERALETNPRLIDAHLLRVEHLIQGERFDGAEAVLARVEALYASHPEAWAYRTALRTLLGEGEDAIAEARAKALERNAKNAEVPHVAGRILSRRYRFAEGAALQREALEMDPGHLEAKLQLASDLMRLGEDEEAWSLVEEVADRDRFNVLAFNYTVLRDVLAEYETVETEHFRVRMKPEDVPIYGDRVMSLLEAGREALCPKYGVTLDRQILVEIYAEQQDFAIRTFGQLGGAGYLGVCFGPVITMNRPGSPGTGDNNWEATLWHEFCHVVTLTATRNRMPRWLSEGISVYEERLRSPVWGQRMTPTYRKRILSEDGLTPVSELSSAFLTAESGEDVMFAYYQSSLVVEFFAERFGEGALRALLAELADGVLINEAIERTMGPLGELEEEFADFARGRAEAFGPNVDWSELAEGELPQEALEVQPNHFWALQGELGQAIRQEEWARAEELAQRLIDLLPSYGGAGNGYAWMARAARGAGDSEAEAEALRQWARRSADAPAAYLRLLELEKASENWKSLRRNAVRQLAVNPFLPKPHRCRACAARALGREDEAIDSLEKLLRLGPENPAEVHFELAELRLAKEPGRARAHLLDALVEAPRYREAHRLLLKMKSEGKEAP